MYLFLEIFSVLNDNSNARTDESLASLRKKKSKVFALDMNHEAAIRPTKAKNCSVVPRYAQTIR